MQGPASNENNTVMFPDSHSGKALGPGPRAGPRCLLSVRGCEEGGLGRGSGGLGVPVAGSHWSARGADGSPPGELPGWRVQGPDRLPR